MPSPPRRPLFRNEAAIGKLLLHAIGIGLGLVDLVHGHDDRYFRGLGVIDGFERLRHHAVVGGNHDDDDVRDLGAAGTHAGKGFVARRIEEDDLAARSRRAFLREAYLVGADVLRDAAGFACRHVGLADRVEQRGLAVIDVAHDGDDGRARHFEFVGIRRFEHFFDGLVRNLLFVADHRGGRAEFRGDVLHHLGVERLVDGDEDTAHEQDGDQVLGANLELLGQVLYADALGHGDFPRDRHRLVAELCGAAKTWRRHEALHRAFLRLGILLATAAPRRVAHAAGAALQSAARCTGAEAAGTGSAKSAGTRARIRAADREIPDGRRARRDRRAWKTGARGMLGPRAAGELAGSSAGPGVRWNPPGPALAGRRSKMGLPR